jgi:hypothetical protein
MAERRFGIGFSASWKMSEAFVQRRLLLEYSPLVS